MSTNELHKNETLLLLTILFSVMSYAQDSARQSESDARILSIYHGLADIPPVATQLFCNLPPAPNQDGMPVVLSVQVDSETITPNAFAADLVRAKPLPFVCDASSYRRIVRAKNRAPHRCLQSR